MKKPSAVRNKILPLLKPLHKDLVVLWKGIELDNDFNALEHAEKLAKAFTDIAEKINQLEA